VVNAGAHTGISHQAHQNKNDERADADRQDEVEKAAAQQEEAGGEVVAPQAVDVGGPHVEDRKRTPLSFGGGGKVLVVQRRLGVGWLHSILRLVVFARRSTRGRRSIRSSAHPGKKARRWQPSPWAGRCVGRWHWAEQARSMRRLAASLALA